MNNAGTELKSFTADGITNGLVLVSSIYTII